MFRRLGSGEKVTSKYYYSDGSSSRNLDSSKILHREDGPAVEFSNGYKEWNFEGRRHRVGGPAVEFRNGEKKWFFEGKLHREDGPAVNGEWWVDGEEMTEEQHAQVMKEVDELPLELKLIDPRKWVRQTRRNF